MGEGGGERPLLLELQSRETHHCDSHKTYCDKGDTETTERLWNIAICHLLADSTHADNSKEPTETRTESINECIENATDLLSVGWIEVDTLLHEERSTHDSTVYSNQWKEDTKSCIK